MKRNNQLAKKEKSPAKTPVLTKKVQPATRDAGQKQTLSWQHYVFIFLIAVVTYLCHQPAASNQLLKTWDDPAYVLDNKLLHGLTYKNISGIFSFHKDLQKLTKNYHPLSTLSLAVNYQFSGLNPRGYHLTNILIHILNSILVYLLIYLIADRRIWAALLAGLLFGIHPMHVESVAWVSERKDVMYAFFFISGLILYYFYVKKKKPLYLVLALVLFYLSVISKAMAVVFPVVLFLMDLHLQRKWSYRLLIEKIPFFIISAFYGWIAIRIQSEGAINEWQTFTLYQRVIHASYGFLSYLYDFFAPFSLSAFYPYPFINEHGDLPLEFRIAPFIFLFIMALAVGSLFVKNKMVRVFGIGMLFYFITVALVLQFLSVGKAITADRYTYIPYIGILFILGSWWSSLMENKKPAYKIAGFAAGAVFLAFSAVIAVQTYNRSAVWHDDITLWSNALDQYPDMRMNFIRVKRADQYFDKEDFQNAMKDYQIMASLDAKDDQAPARIGQIYGQQFHQLDSALVWLNKAYKIDPGNLTLLKNLGVAYAIKNDISKSLEFFLEAYARDPADSTLLLNISTNYRALGNIEKSKEFENLARKKK
jgi:hypothetical protein